jgi:hypothetical protein
MKKMHSFGEMHFVICGSPLFWNQYDPTGSWTSELSGLPLTATPEITTPQ